MEKIILASASPRRQDILRGMGIDFEISPQDVDESFKGMPAAEEAARIAALKVEKCLKNACSTETPGNAERWILGADTFIELDGKFLGKPANRDDARRMLEKLSDRTHKVVTGVALHIPGGNIKTAFCVTDVTFIRLSDAEIEWYLDQNEWKGAAAAYRLQEKGAFFISELRGSCSNVMGLPINTIYGMLMAANYAGKSGDFPAFPIVDV